MATPLSICIEEEQHAVIRFLWAEVVPGTEISGRIFASHGNSTSLNAVFVNGFPCLKVSLMMNHVDTYPCSVFMKTLNESVPCF
jgi:ribosomal protein L35AE/L33A